MIKLKKTYVDINGIVLDKNTYYLVTFTKCYELSLFGTPLKEFKRVKEVPFVFKSLEVAKDFCELHPKYQKITIRKESESNIYTTTYDTYLLTLGNKINAYIIWKETSLKYSWNSASYTIQDYPYPIIAGFFKYCDDIKLETSYDSILKHPAPTLNHGIIDKLSDIFSLSETDKYHFELIEK